MDFRKPTNRAKTDRSVVYHAHFTVLARGLFGRRRRLFGRRRRLFGRRRRLFGASCRSCFFRRRLRLLPFGLRLFGLGLRLFGCGLRSESRRAFLFRHTRAGMPSVLKGNAQSNLVTHNFRGKLEFGHVDRVDLVFAEVERERNIASV